MSGSADHRPWLILSRSEAIALHAAAHKTCSCQRVPRAATGPLARALRIIDLQLRFIDGALDGDQPSVAAALERETQP